MRSIILQLRLRLPAFLLFGTFSAAAASAQSIDEVTVTGCGPGGATVHVPNMGMVTKEHLQQHMDRMTNRLDQARRTEPRTSMHRKLLEAHMADMASAMEALQAAREVQRCASEDAAPSLDARVADLERRLSEIQDMLDQMIKHVREAEREQ